MGGGSGRKTADGHFDHGGRWITASDWPVPEAKEHALYLQPGGQLAETLPDTTSRLTFQYDPANPVPTIGGNFSSFEPLLKAGSFDQVARPEFYGATEPFLPLSARADVLAFQTEPLQRALEVVGPVTIDLWVGSDCPDTDITVKLVDVSPPNDDYPHGYAMLVAYTIYRLRYAEDPASPRLLSPDKRLRLLSVAFWTANLFAPCHKLRVDISSSNFPKFDLNPNTGEAEGEGRIRNVARNSVFIGPDAASRLVLPIVSL